MTNSTKQDKDTPTNTLEETELKKLVQDYLYDEIQTELENDSMHKNVWEYLDNGSQKPVRWVDKAERALMALISQEVNKARIDEVDKIPIVGHINHLTGRRIDINTQYKADRKAVLTKTNTHMEGDEDEA